MFQKFNFDTQWAVQLISRISHDEDFPMEGRAIVKQLLSLQINAEKCFFGIRKNLVEFDEVLEVQRKHVYDLRQLILTGDFDSCSLQIFQYMQAVADEIILNNVDPTKHPSSWSLGNLLKEFYGVSADVLNDSFAGITEEDLLQSLMILLPAYMISVRTGKFRSTVNLLCKYSGDILIGSYLDVIQESGYDSKSSTGFSLTDTCKHRTVPAPP